MPDIPCLDPDRPLTPSELADERRERIMRGLEEPDPCPYCGRELEDPSELRTGLCSASDCPRHDDPEHIE
jgi:hypothetical protein